MIKNNGHQVTLERILRQRVKLGLAPHEVFGRNSLHLSAQIHGVLASDGSRWSNHAAAQEREDALKWMRLR